MAEKQITPASESRLWELIDERLRPGADIARIDADIWALFGQTWAIMFTDLTGFSRMVAEFGIIHFLQVICEQRALFVPIIAAHGGILLKDEADSMMILFETTEGAIDCAVAMNDRTSMANVGRRPEDKVLLCVGIGYGHMLRVGDRDVFGQEVNAASKLGEDIAEADQILVTDAARAACSDRAGIIFEPIAATVAGSAKNFRVLEARAAR